MNRIFSFIESCVRKPHYVNVFAMSLLLKSSPPSTSYVKPPYTPNPSFPYRWVSNLNFSSSFFVSACCFYSQVRLTKRRTLPISASPTAVRVSLGPLDVKDLTLIWKTLQNGLSTWSWLDPRVKSIIVPITS